MRRLSMTYEDGTHDVAKDLPCGENSYAYKDMLIESIGAYEDIGLTPEQLREVDMLYAEKCKEVAELKKELAQMKELPKLPCKVGDSLFGIESGSVVEFKAKSLNQIATLVEFNCFNNNVFFSKEKASQVLKENDSEMER